LECSGNVVLRRNHAFVSGSKAATAISEPVWVRTALSARADAGSPSVVTPIKTSRTVRSPRRHFFAAMLGLAILGAGTAAVGAPSVPERREWRVDGLVREGLVYLPAGAKAAPSPVIFAFHGHGGSMQNAARSFAYHTLWPEAVVVYLQGLKTPGLLTDPEGKRSGWQASAGDQGDRDLKFFDTVLAALRSEGRVDEQRIYVTGHSNGGGFTYLLWAQRGEVFAAAAPSGAAGAKVMGSLTPKPMLHVAGEADPLVKYAWQKAMMAAVLKLNQAGPGTPWKYGGEWHDSKVGAPTVVWVHKGGHAFPPAARTAIVEFFRLHVRK
jgi:polyhydroxybutyrate depolymerase